MSSVITFQQFLTSERPYWHVDEGEWQHYIRFRHSPLGPHRDQTFIIANDAVGSWELLGVYAEKYLVHQCPCRPEDWNFFARNASERLSTNVQNIIHHSLMNIQENVIDGLRILHGVGTCEEDEAVNIRQKTLEKFTQAQQESQAVLQRMHAVFGPALRAGDSDTISFVDSLTGWDAQLAETITTIRDFTPTPASAPSPAAPLPPGGRER
jgi:hypothetical protein